MKYLKKYPIRENLNLGILNFNVLVWYHKTELIKDAISMFEKYYTIDEFEKAEMLNEDVWAWHVEAEDDNIWFNFVHTKNFELDKGNKISIEDFVKLSDIENVKSHFDAEKFGI